MEQYIIQQGHESFCVQFEPDKGWYKQFNGAIYPVLVLEDGTILFESSIMGCDYSPEYLPELKNCRQIFEWSYQWRGVWEGRVYPKEEEYWSEQLREMADLWDLIEPVFKQKIKNVDPTYDYPD